MTTTLQNSNHIVVVLSYLYTCIVLFEGMSGHDPRVSFHGQWNKKILRTYFRHACLSKLVQSNFMYVCSSPYWLNPYPSACTCLLPACQVRFRAFIWLWGQVIYALLLNKVLNVAETWCIFAMLCLCVCVSLNIRFSIIKTQVVWGGGNDLECVRTRIRKVEFWNPHFIYIFSSDF